MSNEKRRRTGTPGSYSRKHGSPLPRSIKRRMSRREDRGLPERSELIALAKQYLQFQHEKFPDLVASNVLPEISEATLDEMANEYMERHKSGNVADEFVSGIFVIAYIVASIYCRFSCDHSKQTSIADQMVQGLNFAHGRNLFVPWQFVFADFAISGLTPNRPGYIAAKNLIELEDSPIQCTIIDDFTRASRTHIEWWKLAKSCEDHKKGLYGVSDNFDVSNSDAKMKMTVYGLLSELFIEGLREKVLRGMIGAAGRGTVLGKPPIGFTRAPVLDENEQPILDADGKTINMLCIDETSAVIAREVYDLFLDEKLSPYAIAKQFNQESKRDWNGWTEAGIRKILWNPAYIGVFIWNRNRTVTDFDTGKKSRMANPRSEWIVYDDPNLEIIPIERWAASRKRLAKRKRRRNGKPESSRNQVNASTLLSGTLECEDCGQELTLSRSAGKYKNMHCVNGRMAAHGCSLCTSKSVRIIETAILTAIGDKILSEQYLDRLVKSANAFIQLEKAKPRVDVGPLRKRVREIRVEIDKLVRLIVEEQEVDAAGGFKREKKRLETELVSLNKRISAAEKQNKKPVDELDSTSLRDHLADIRELLNGDIKTAAEEIREFTGPIKIRQEPHPDGKRGARWIATLSPNLVEILKRVTPNKDCPETITLEYLCAANWTVGEPLMVTIDELPQYQVNGPVFRAKHDGGMSIQEIAEDHDVTWQVACEMIAYGTTRLIPNLDDRDNPARVAGWDRFREVAALVAELRDNDGLEWSWIIDVVTEHVGFSVSINTVLRAYEFAHNRPTGRRGLMTYRMRLGNEKFEEFKELFEGGLTNMAELARRIGCARSTIRRWNNRLRHN